MSNIYKKFTEAIKNLSLSFTRESLLAGFFFFLVLCSWYVLRPVRNEMAVQAGLENIPFLLSIVLLVMLFANPIYSWVISRIKRDRIVVYIYLFFILNLFCFLLGWNFLEEPGRVWIAKIFYIWCNVYSFFVVSIIFINSCFFILFLLIL